MDASNALLIFIKNPLAGKVKTRLATSLGEQEALQIYQQLLQRALETTTPLSCTKYLYYSSFIDNHDQWSPKNFQKMLQKGADLGIRMHHALQTALQKHGKAVLIGSDIPELNRLHIEEAFQALETADYVLGPARDGGYYLVGMKDPASTIFGEIPWSTSEVMQLTLRRILEEGKSYHLLPILSDIDYPEDWQQLGW